MSLMIPTIGTELILFDDWTFRLFAESRNMNFSKTVNAPWNVGTTGSRYSFGVYEDAPGGRRQPKQCLVTLPRGTRLTVARIYIRQGKDEYDSITFSLPKRKGQTAHGRFWVKLADANAIRCGFVEATLPDPEGCPKQAWAVLES